MNNTKKFADLIQKVDANIKRKFRLLERTKSNIIKKEWSIKYNEICIKENLLPKYTKLFLCKHLNKKYVFFYILG